MTKNRFIGLIALFICGVLFAIVPSAIADKPPSPPGQGECEHGNSGKECKPDPQPGHGKECDKHGNNGGINEDHCKGTSTTRTTSTVSSSTTTTIPTTTRQTTTQQTSTIEQTTSTSTTSQSGSSGETTTSITKPPSPNTAPAPARSKAIRAANARGHLPYTGISLVLVALFGLLLTSTGLLLRRKVSNENT